MSSSVTHSQVTKISESGMHTNPDLLAVEEPLEIRVGYGPHGSREQKSLSVTMRTPGHDFELATGFLFTEAIIESYDQIESVKYCEDVGRVDEKDNVVRVELKPEVRLSWEKLLRNFYTSSSCGVCGKSSLESVSVTCSNLLDGLTVHRKVVYSLPAKLRSAQSIFEHTGGLHAVGLFNENGDLELLREDVGRHNAMDKVVGASLFKKAIPLNKKILLVSGRASFELVQKALRAGVPILAAVGAPSSLAVSLAASMNMTLLGFVKEKVFNIYSGATRIE